MTWDLDEFLDGYERPTALVPVCKRAGLLARHRELEAEVLAQRGESLGGASAELLAELEAVEREIEESVRVFRLSALSHQEWADLMAQHPPTPEQRKEGHGANPDTFGPAALAACAVEPAVTVEQAQRLQQTLPPGEWETLMLELRTLNQGKVNPPKSLLLSAARRMNGASSGQQHDTESLAAGSSADVGEP